MPWSKKLWADKAHGTKLSQYVGGVTRQWQIACQFGGPVAHQPAGGSLALLQAPEQALCVRVAEKVEQLFAVCARRGLGCRAPDGDTGLDYDGARSAAGAATGHFGGQLPSGPRRQKDGTLDNARDRDERPLLAIRPGQKGHQVTAVLCEREELVASRRSHLCHDPDCQRASGSPNVFQQPREVPGCLAQVRRLAPPDPVQPDQVDQMDKLQGPITLEPAVEHDAQPEFCGLSAASFGAS